MTLRVQFLLWGFSLWHFLILISITDFEWPSPERKPPWVWGSIHLYGHNQKRGCRPDPKLQVVQVRPTTLPGALQIPWRWQFGPFRHQKPSPFQTQDWWLEETVVNWRQKRGGWNQWRLGESFDNKKYWSLFLPWVFKPGSTTIIASELLYFQVWHHLHGCQCVGIIACSPKLAWISTRKSWASKETSRIKTSCWRLTSLKSTPSQTWKILWNSRSTAFFAMVLWVGWI